MRAKLQDAVHYASFGYFLAESQFDELLLFKFEKAKPLFQKPSS